MIPQRRTPRLGRASAPLAFLAVLAAVGRLDAQTTDLNRERAQEMLRDMKDVLKRTYYDPAFHGVDVDAHFKQFEPRLAEASSEGHLSGLLAQALVELNDSHTFFIPPPLPFKADYGWQIQMVGDTCLLVAVKPGSDAEKKGLRRGWVIRAVEGVAPTRETLWKINYSLRVLRPRTEVRLSVAEPDGTRREVAVATAITKGARFASFDDYIEEVRDKAWQRKDARWHDLGDALAMQLSTFSAKPEVLGDLIKRLRGKKALILDLRGNHGGSVDFADRLIGVFLPEGTVIGETRERKKTRPIEVRDPGRGPAFDGKLVVLVDSESASASEVLARAVQIQGRGTVVGDRTAGAVMQSVVHRLTQGHQYRFLLYAVSVTQAEVLMSDGGRLERQGVTPDLLVRPTSADLESGADPVLARAAQLAGASLDSQAAGRIFPREWPR